MSILFTEQVMRQAAEILDKYHRAASAAVYGKDALSTKDWNEAVRLGLINPKAAAETLSSQVYRYGVLIAHMDQAQRQSRYGTTGAQWLAEIAKNPTPMTTLEQNAAAYANHRAAQFVVGLGRRATSTLGTTVLVEDAALSNEFRSIIRDVLSARYGDEASQQRLDQLGIDKDLPEDFFKNTFRSSLKRLRSKLGNATGNWERDMERIAATESIEAFNQGQADGWQTEAAEEAVENEEPQKEVLCYRVPSPSACTYCLRLYTTSGSYGGDVRVFYLSDLSANGNNFNTKRSDWKPIVGATHPFCACDLQRLPPYIRMPKGWKSGDSAPSVVDPDGTMFSDPLVWVSDRQPIDAVDNEGPESSSADPEDGD